MLRLAEVSLFIKTEGEVCPLLADLNLKFPRKHFAAIIGPSGCGKSTLLKVITGVARGEEEGKVSWDGRDLEEADFSPAEIGYVPQFSIAHEELTARESVEYAMRLRVGGRSRGEVSDACERILAQVGLTEAADRHAKVLSGGQRRRLALAMEMVSAPAILQCDEVTSGLDPSSEDEIVRLLRAIATDSERLVLSVTHSLRHLSYYDSVVVLYRGVLAYHGRPEFLCHYFSVDDPQHIYDRLSQREPQDWAKSWKKHGEAFTAQIVEESVEPPSEKPSSEEIADDQRFAPNDVEPDQAETQPIEVEAEDVDGAGAVRLPNSFSQFSTLLERRIRIFTRSKAQMLLQAGLIFGFPLIVAVFAWNGLPQVKNLSMGMDLNMLQQAQEAMAFLAQASKIGSLVSGIVMFQVVLLTLMGANNSGREIASERLILEKEKLAGVRAGSYVASKAVFMALLVAAQSFWMGTFVHTVCGLPGALGSQLVFLLLVNAAMTAVCLGISSLMGTAEQASLVSIYLVGFQLPLSGAVLALPQWLGEVTRPFIAAYWSWAGVLQTLKAERYYDIVRDVVQTSLSPASLCVWVLAFHVLFGLFIAWMGCRRTCWE